MFGSSGRLYPLHRGGDLEKHLRISLPEGVGRRVQACKCTYRDDNIRVSCKSDVKKQAAGKCSITHLRPYLRRSFLNTPAPVVLKPPRSLVLIEARLQTPFLKHEAPLRD